MPDIDASSLASLYTAQTVAPTDPADGQMQAQRGQGAIPRTLPRTTATAVAAGYGAPAGGGALGDALLEPSNREKKRRELQDRLGDWLQNVHTAITGARIEVATETEEGGDWLTEMVFAFVAGGVMPGILSMAVAAIGKVGATLATEGVAKIRQRIAAGEKFDKAFEANEEGIKDLLEKGTDPLVDKVKERTTKGANEDSSKRKKRGKDRFLEAMASKATLAKQALTEQVPSLNDVDLICLHDAYDAHHHSVGRYHSFLDQLLARYDENRIGELGQRQADGHDLDHVNDERVLRAVKVTAFGKTRTAIVEQSFRVRYRGSDWGDAPPPMDPAHEDIVRHGLPRFVRWTDGDFAALAQARSAAGKRASFGAYFSTEIWPAGDVYDVTDDWSQLDPDDKTELLMWRDDCKAVAAGARPSMQLDDTITDPAKAFLTAEGDDTEESGE